MAYEGAIESVPLYRELDRIEKGLAGLGLGPRDPIRPEQLFDLDQWHYHGPEAIGAGAEALQLGPASRVLEIGAGIGGPARFLAYSSGCRVTAPELQPRLDAIWSDLTRRCGLAERVTHLCGDALSYPLPGAGFDAVVSFLAVEHIPDRPRLCERLARALRSGGACYIEDLYMRAPFADSDLHDIREVLFCVSLTSIDDYVADLRAAGFKDILATDLTSDWAPYANARLATWRENHALYAASHGEGAYAALERFYALIAHFYNIGSFGGVRVVARV